MEKLNYNIESLAVAFAQANLISELSKNKDLPIEKQVECFYNSLEAFVFETKIIFKKSFLLLSASL